MPHSSRRVRRGWSVLFALLLLPLGQAFAEGKAAKPEGQVDVPKMTREEALAYLGVDQVAQDADILVSLVMNGEVETVEALLAAGLDVNGANLLRKPILRIAMSACASQRYSPERQLAMAEVLLSHGAAVNEEGGELSPLMVAAQHCPAPMVRRLLAAGADSNFKTSLGYSPLAMAFVMKNYAAAEALIESGARLSAAAAARLLEGKNDDAERVALLKKAQGG